MADDVDVPHANQFARSVRAIPENRVDQPGRSGSVNLEVLPFSSHHRVASQWQPLDPQKGKWIPLSKRAQILNHPGYFESHPRGIEIGIDLQPRRSWQFEIRTLSRLMQSRRHR